MNRAKLLTLALCLAPWIARPAPGDTPPRPPKVKVAASANKQFFAVMDPKNKETTIYRANADGFPLVQWTMQGWFEVAALADDGKHLIVGYSGNLGNLLPLSVTKNFPMIQFYKTGKRINTVTLGDLVQDLPTLHRTASHYHWGEYLGLDKDGRYVVQTVEGRRLAFDVTTGKLASIDTSPAKAMKRAVAAAEAWLALLDEGKYADAWETAAQESQERTEQRRLREVLKRREEAVGESQIKGAQIERFHGCHDVCCDGCPVLLQDLVYGRQIR